MSTEELASFVTFFLFENSVDYFNRGMFLDFVVSIVFITMLYV